MAFDSAFHMDLAVQIGTKESNGNSQNLTNTINCLPWTWQMIDDLKLFVDF